MSEKTDPAPSLHYPSNGWVNGGSGVSPPEVFIQWKGTDLCCDFHCECGAHHHIDAYFVYGIKCTCGACYEMPSSVALKRVPEAVACTHFCQDQDDA